MTAEETLEYVRLRCHCDDETGCWTWKLAVGRRGEPQMYSPADRETGPVRRALSRALHGPIRSNVWVVGTCDNDRCVAPEHAKRISRSKRLQGLKPSGKSVLLRIKSNRARSSLCIEDAQAIRASDESHAELARRYGKSPSLIRLIRLNRCWRDATSPFAGLMR